MTDEIIKDDTIVEETETAKESKHVKKDKLKKCEDKIDHLELEIKTLKEEKLLALAEMENFKKRMTKEMVQDRKYGSKNLITDILGPLDQLNRVVQMKTDDPALTNFLIGFKMINEQIYKVLEDDGLQAIDALNKPFDPNYHYAVEKVKDESKPRGINVEVIQPGYMYKDQLLRPAMVKVNEWSDENGEDK